MFVIYSYVFVLMFVLISVWFCCHGTVSCCFVSSMSSCCCIHSLIVLSTLFSRFRYFLLFWWQEVSFALFSLLLSSVPGKEVGLSALIGWLGGWLMHLVAYSCWSLSRRTLTGRYCLLCFHCCNSGGPEWSFDFPQHLILDPDQWRYLCLLSFSPNYCPVISNCGYTCLV